MSFSIFSQREWLARGIALAIGILLFVYQGALIIRHIVPRPAQVVQIKLVSVPPEQPKVVPPPPKPEPLPPKPVVKPQPVVKQVVPQKVASQVAPVPAPVTPEVVPATTVAVDKPVVPQPPVAKAEAKPVVAAQPKGNADSEAGFARDVRKKIEQQKVYPASARELGMAGEVEVRYVIDRSGRLLEVEVATSSGYPLLDRAAVRAVKAAAFKSMLADNWPDAAQKEFRTKIVFSITD